MSLYTKQLFKNVNCTKFGLQNVNKQLLRPFYLTAKPILKKFSTICGVKDRRSDLIIGQCCRLIHSSSVDCKIQGPNDASVNIFDRKAKVLQRERAAKSSDVHLFDYVKEEVGWRLADRVFDIKKTFKNAVDLGKPHFINRLIVFILFY